MKSILDMNPNAGFTATSSWGEITFVPGDAGRTEQTRTTGSGNTTVSVIDAARPATPDRFKVRFQIDWDDPDPEARATGTFFATVFIDAAPDGAQTYRQVEDQAAQSLPRRLSAIAEHLSRQWSASPPDPAQD